MALQLTSSAFSADARIPVHHTCEGDDVSPPLAWTGAPDGTLSFVLLCDDPDAPAGTWHHWALYGIPPSTHELKEAYPREPRVGATRQGNNDFRVSGYRGPCPPKGHGTHHYHFRLLALKVATLDVGDGATCQEIENAARPHVLASAELIGLYSRS